MSNEDLKCPYCGATIKLHQCLGHDRFDFDCDCEQIISIWAETEDEAIKTLSRRYVCNDTNDEPVHAGDDVKLGNQQGRIELDLVGGAIVATKTHRLRLITWRHHQIELIKTGGGE